MYDSPLTLLLNINWQEWTALATTAYAAFTLLALGGVLLIRKQLVATNKARRLEALNEIYRLIHTPAAKAARGAIYRSRLDEFSDRELEELMRPWRSTFWRRTRQELTLEAVEMTADMWHHVGLLAEKGLVEKDVLYDYFAWPLLNSYRRMRRYITWRRSRDNPAYAKHFVSIASDFEERFRRQHGDGVFFRLFHASTLQDQ